MAERAIDALWVQRTVEAPDWTADDPLAGRTRYYKSIPEFGDRILRVVCFEDESERRIITLFFGRDARKPS